MSHPGADIPPTPLRLWIGLEGADMPAEPFLS